MNGLRRISGTGTTSFMRKRNLTACSGDHLYVGMTRIHGFNIKQTQSFKEIVLANSQLYLEAKNTADEDKHDENQAHVTESSNLLFVGEVIRLGKSEGQNELQVCAGSRYQCLLSK